MGMPGTIGELCQMLTDTGECKDAQIYHNKQAGKDYYTCISECKKLDGFINKYWGIDNGTDI